MFLEDKPSYLLACGLALASPQVPPSTIEAMREPIVDPMLLQHLLCIAYLPV